MDSKTKKKQYQKPKLEKSEGLNNVMARGRRHKRKKRKHGKKGLGSGLFKGKFGI